jgi:tRNA(Leu) C34 or U34 (ribose-2'-O)-methylase TrmL
MSSKEDRERLLKALADAWERHPELRLGQLVECVANMDVFYIRDHELCDKLLLSKNELGLSRVSNFLSLYHENTQVRGRFASMGNSFFAIGIEHSKTRYNVGSLWRSADLFGAAFIFTVGCRYKPQPSDTMKSWKSIPLFHYETINDLVEHLPSNCQLVGVEIDEGSVLLETFEHPQRCCYLLGAEDHGLTYEAIDRSHKLIQLPGRVSMNVAAAGSIIMYDRHFKQEVIA